MKIIKGIPPKLPSNTYVAMDSEWVGMNEKTMHRPISGQFALLTVCYQPDEVWYVDNPDDVPAVLNAIDDAVWLVHYAKFDLMHLRRLATIPPRTKLADTEMMERILWSGYYDHFSEQALARRYLHEHLDKSLQKAWGTATEITPELLEYACRDSETLLRIWYEQKKCITKADLQVYKTIDLPALWAVLDFQGFRVDSQKWIELAEHHRQLSDEIDEQLPINPRSYKIVTAYLRERGFKGLPSSKESVLEEYGLKYPNCDAAKLASQILLARGYRHNSSTYGKNMLDNFGEVIDECTYFFGDFCVTRASTGRMSCSDPDLHNIPIRETNVFRECFIPKPENDLVIGDYSQQEVFIMAYLSQDKTLLDVCNSGKDIYIQMAKMIFGKEIYKKDPLRKDMKSVVLGTDYGMSKYGLSKKINRSVDEAQRLLDEFFRTFPGVRAWMNSQNNIGKYTQTVAGRKAWLNVYKNKSQRNAYNNPIQGTAADIIKICMAQMHKNWNFDCPFGIVAVVHDELVLDVPKTLSKSIAEFTKFHMEDAANKMLPGMNFKSDVHVGFSWSKES